MENISLTEGLNRRDFIRTVGLGLGAVAVGGPPWAYGQARKDIIVAAPSPARAMYNLPQYWAGERILKPEMGIVIKDKTFRGFVPSFAAMVTGDVDYPYQTLVGITRAIKQKFPVRGFIGYTEQFLFYMVAAPDIKSLDELVSRIKQRAKSGRKIKFASHSPTSLTQVTTNVILREKGVDPKTDVEIIFLAGTPKRLAALKAKSVDATVVFASRAIEAAMRGDLNVVAKMSDFAPKQTATMWVATEETLNKRPKDVQLYTNAMVRSYRDMYKRDLDELAEFAVAQKPWSKFKPVRAVRETIKAAREMELWPVDGGITKERIATAQKFLVGTKSIEPDEVLPFDRLVTTRFRDQALKDLGSM